MALMDEARLFDILEDAMKANESTAYLNILKSVHQAVTALFGEKRKCATANQEVFVDWKDGELLVQVRRRKEEGKTKEWFLTITMRTPLGHIPLYATIQRRDDGLYIWGAKDFYYLAIVLPRETNELETPHIIMKVWGDCTVLMSSSHAVTHGIVTITDGKVHLI